MMISKMVFPVLIMGFSLFVFAGTDFGWPLTDEDSSSVFGVNCSDASGKIRRQLIYQNNNREVRWIFQGEAMETKELNILYDTRTQVRGNEKDGVYVLDVEVTYQGRTFKIPMLCLSYNQPGSLKN